MKFNKVTVKEGYLKAMQLHPDNIEDFEGTLLPRKDRVVCFCDKYTNGGCAVKYPNDYIRVVSTLLFSEIY